MASLGEETVVLSLRMDDETAGPLAEHSRAVQRAKDANLKFVKALKEEAKALSMGADALRREQAARKGATDAQLKAIDTYQKFIQSKRDEITQQKLAVDQARAAEAEQKKQAEAVKRLNDQIELQRVALVEGADAAELYRAKLAGATTEQLEAIASNQNLAKAQKVATEATRKQEIETEKAARAEKMRQQSLRNTVIAEQDSLRAARLGNDVLVRRKLLREGATRAEVRAIRQMQLSTKVAREQAMAQSAVNQQMRQLRGMAGQMGHQFQDIAVQAQMGTNAMIILGQQGSQIASIMGPHGAMIGAVIAVAAALSTLLVDGAEDATDALEDLRSKTKESYEELYNLNAEQRIFNANRIQERIEENEKAFKTMSSSVDEASEALAKHYNAQAALSRAIKLGLNSSIQGYADQAARVALTAEEIKRYERVITDSAAIEQTLIADKEKLLEISKLNAQGINAESQAYKELNDTQKQAENEKKRLADEERTLAELDAVINLKEEIARLDREAAENKDKQASKDEAQVEKEINAILKLKHEYSKWQKESAADKEKARLKDEQNTMDGLNRELNAITFLADFKEKKRQEEEEAVMAQIDNEIAARERLREYATAQAEKQLDEQLKLIGGFKTLEQAGTQALTNLIMNGGSLKDAFSAIGTTITQAVIQSLVQMGVEYVKQKLMMKAIDSTMRAAMLAENTATSSIVATQWAPAAALASLATLGTNAVPAQGAIAATTGFAAMMAQTGSFEGGGYTGFGVRSGGIDGKGGFMATVHPNETIIDHHKGQGTSQPVNVNFNISAVDARGVDQLLAERQGMIVSMVNRAMNNAGKRGVV